MADVIFDLDGTLVDSVPGIDEAVAIALADAAPTLAPRTMRPFVGPPIRAMLGQAYPDAPPAALDAAAARFRTAYDGGSWANCAAYPGAVETLAALTAAGHRCFVATIKPALPTGRILALTGLAPHVREAVSPDSVAPPYPDKAAAVAALMARHGIVAGAACLVGDGLSDLVAAEAHGLTFFAAVYGYGGITAAHAPGRALAALPDLVAAWPPLAGVPRAAGGC